MSTPVEAPVADAATAADRQFVTFEVAGEMFAVPMAPVQEIIRVPEVARLPLAPPALDGLANLRGRVLPIMNLRRLFGAEERAADDATRALVIQLGQPLGFVVDRVASVVNIEPGELQPADRVQSLVQAEGLSGVIQRAGSDGQAQPLTLVLDFERLVGTQFAALAQRASAGAAGTAQDEGRTAAATGAEAGPADELRLVSFTVAGQEYALDIADVQEIVHLPEQVSGVPNAPAHLLGLISLRQRLLPLVSLRRLFGLPPTAADEQHRIVVVALPGGAQVGLVTDAVKEVLSVPRQQAEPVPPVLARDGSLQEFEAICRLDGGKRLVSIIDTVRLLGVQGLREALAAAREAGGHSGETLDMNASADSHEAHDGRNGRSDDDQQLVIFRLGADEFGVPITSVQEIVRVPETLTRVPRTPEFVEGVINLRGTVLPVIDQRRRLGLPAIDRNDGQRIMVYALGGLRTGFIVDAVAEVLRVPAAQITAAPALSDEQGRLLRQVAQLEGGKRLVMLIEPTQLLQGDEAHRLAALAPAEAAMPEPAPLARAA